MRRQMPSFPRQVTVRIQRHTVLLSDLTGTWRASNARFFSLFILAVISFTLLLRRLGGHKHVTSKALQSFLIPNRSHWPAVYNTLARSSSETLVKLSLGQLFGDVRTGRLELRNPKRNLSALVAGDLAVDGIHFCLYVGVGFLCRITYSLVYAWYNCTDKKVGPTYSSVHDNI